MPHFWWGVMKFSTTCGRPSRASWLIEAVTVFRSALTSILTLVLFASFTAFQTGRHREYFLPLDDGDPATEDIAPRPSARAALASLALLLVSLVVVVLSAK